MYIYGHNSLYMNRSWVFTPHNFTVLDSTKTSIVPDWRFLWVKVVLKIISWVVDYYLITVNSKKWTSLWELPGGLVEWSETLGQSMWRESQEELNVDLEELVRLWGVKIYRILEHQVLHRWNIIWSVVTVFMQADQNLHNLFSNGDSEENEAVYFVDVNSLLDVQPNYWVHQDLILLDQWAKQPNSRHVARHNGLNFHKAPDSSLFLPSPRHSDRPF